MEQDKSRDFWVDFQRLRNEFKRERVNGNLTLHFSQGVEAKIHSTKVI